MSFCERAYPKFRIDRKVVHERYKVLLWYFLLLIFIIYICLSSLFPPSLGVKLSVISLHLHYHCHCPPSQPPFQKLLMSLLFFNGILFFSASSYSYSSSCSYCRIVAVTLKIIVVSGFLLCCCRHCLCPTLLCHIIVLFFFFLLLYSFHAFLYFKLLIWLIHFVWWIELKENKRQHPVFHIHMVAVLMTSLSPSFLRLSLIIGYCLI